MAYTETGIKKLSGYDSNWFVVDDVNEASRLFFLSQIPIIFKATASTTLASSVFELPGRNSFHIVGPTTSSLEGSLDGIVWKSIGTAATTGTLVSSLFPFRFFRIVSTNSATVDEVTIGAVKS